MSEAAEGLNFMALAGWDTEEMLGGLDGVMNLAAASGEDLGTVSDIVTDALSAFGLEAKDSAQFADVLAATSANANTDVVGLGNAFKYVAPVAGALGFTVEDTAKAIGIMSDNGIKGEKAGTALRTMMTNLAKPTKAMQEEMDNLGISLTDTDGNMKTFDEIMNDLRGSFSGLTEEQQASAAATIFGKESMSGALAIINATEESFDGLGEAINNSEGEAQRMSDTMEGTLGGTWREIKSGIEGLAISIYEAMLPALTKVSEKVLEAIQWLNSLSPKVKMLGVIFGAVAAAIGPLLVVGGSFLMFLGGVFRAITPVTAAIAKAGSVTKWLALALKPLGALFAALTGPVGITIGVITLLGAAFTVAYAKSETFRNIIQGLIQRFKEFIPIIVSFSQSIYTNFMNLVIPAVTAVKTFFLDMFAKIKQFWQSDGEQVIAAIINGVNIVKTIVSAVMPVITTIIGTAFKLALAIVQMVWANIKGVINGTLNVIMGLVKVFSGIFTGDFSKMWEGVKQIFSGSIQAVWNGFQLLFYGRIIKGVGSLVRIFSGSIRNLWTTVVQFFQNLFTGSVQRVQSLFVQSNQIVNNLVAMFFRLISNMVQRVLGLFRNLFSTGTNIISNLRNGVTNTITSMRDNVVSRVGNMVSRVLGFFRNLFTTGTNIISNLRNGVTNTITVMRDNVVSRVGNMRDNALNGFRTLKDRGSNLVRELKDNAINRFNDMVKGARELPGKMGAAIKNGTSKAVDGIKSLGNSMVNQLEKVINGIIRGLNSVTSKLGITATIEEWNAPQFSTGTGGSKGVASGMAARFSKGTRNGRIANDMLGIVNDKGPGNGRGGAVQELIEDKAGNLFAPRGKNVTVQLDKGDRIYSGAETQSLMSAGLLPKFSQGTGVDRPDSRSAKKSKGVWGSMKDILANTFDYIKNPGKVMEAIISNITSKIQGLSGFAMNMAKGGFNFIKDNALKFITDIFKKNEGGMGQGKRGKFMNYRMTTPYSPNRPVPGYPRSFNGGRHMGIDYGTPVGTDVNATLPGKVTKMSNHGGGLVAKLQSGDITQFFMHLSSVLKTGAVAMGDLIGKTGNSGAWTTGPHIHWQAQKGSQVMNRNTFDPRKVLKGHSKGGYIQKGGLFNLHDNEYVLPMNEPTEAMKLLALVGKDLAGKSKQTRQLPNVGAGNSTNETVEALKEIAMNQQTQIDQMTKAIAVLLGIEDKTGITEGEIGRSNDKYNNRESNKRSRTTGRLSYV